jgi:hypothetical protein
MSDSDTRQAARTYHHGWAHGSGAAEMRPVMAEAFSFRFGDMLIEGREAFLAGGGWPEGAEVTMVAEAYQGEHGFQLFDCVDGDRTVRMCEHLVVRGGLLVSCELVADHVAVGALLSGGKG